MPTIKFSSWEQQVWRLAFVQGWSDTLVERARVAALAAQGDLLALLSAAAEDSALAALRDGCHDLSLRAARAFGFASAEEFQSFASAHPPLSIQHDARPALPGTRGTVINMSATEVLLQTEHGTAFFERAWLPEAAIGLRISITGEGFGRAEIEPGPIHQPSPSSPSDDTHSPRIRERG